MLGVTIVLTRGLSALPLKRVQPFSHALAGGAIALSGGLHGDVGHALHNDHYDLAQSLLDGWQSVFGDRYYLELVRSGRAGEEDTVKASLTLASDTRTPVVASNDVRFLDRDDFNAHEARVCIHDGRVLGDPDRPKHYSEEQYLRSGQEMAELFADIPAALENAREIARRCSLDLELGESVLPAFPVPQDQTEAEFLEAEARRGLETQLERIFETLIEINNRGTTIFLVEQNAHMALSISSIGYVMETGKVILEDKAASLLENDQVKKAYLGN